MKIEEKIEKLNELYKLHDELMQDFDFVCKKTCSSCCTVNVTMTTLEGHVILKALTSIESEIPDIQKRLLERSEKERLVPSVTLNHFAQICIDGGEVPEEENDPVWGVCPLLKEKLCMIYNNRPLGCRTLVSRQRCELIGYADMPNLTLTINNLFTQVVEHLDAGGLYGNLTDVLLGLQSIGKNMDCDTANKEKKSGVLIPNRLMPAMMVPPEDREAIKSVLEKLSKIVPEIISN